MLVEQIYTCNVSTIMGSLQGLGNTPVTVIDPRLCTKQLLFSRLVCQISSHLVAIFFSLQCGDEMYARPHLLAREFARTMSALRKTQFTPSIRIVCHILVLPDSLSDPPESPGHQCGSSEEVYGGTEAPSREIALVLDGAVAARWRHILRHGGQLCSRLNGRSEVRRRGDAEA